MMEKLKYTKFKTLLISSFICISIIPVVLLGLFIFHLSKQELIRQSEKQMWQNSENVSDILDEKLDYIEEFSLKINVDTRIYKIFQNLDTSDSMQLESASQEISKILLDYLPWNNTVYSTHIVTPYYQFGEKEKNYYPNHSFMGSKIQKAADEANGKLVWIPAYNYMDMFSIEDMPRDFLEYEHVFTAVRKLQLSRVESGHIEHLENKTDQMYLVVNFTEDNLNNMLKKYTKANSQILYYIMSEDGSVVGPYGENESKLFRNVTAADMGIEAKNIFYMSNGRTLELDEDDAKFTGSVPSGRVLVDGLGVGDVGNIVLRDRQHLSQDGLIVIVLTMDSNSGEVVAGPDVISRGFVYVRESENLMDDVKSVVRHEISKCEQRGIRDWSTIKSTVRENLRDYIFMKTKRNPMIIPIIMEV